MAGASVLEKLLAVIGDDGDDRVVVEMKCSQSAKDVSDVSVDERDLAVVQRHNVLEIAM
jgi:hypothetical protein